MSADKTKAVVSVCLCYTIFLESLNTFKAASPEKMRAAMPLIPARSSYAKADMIFLSLTMAAHPNHRQYFMLLKKKMRENFTGWC